MEEGSGSVSASNDRVGDEIEDTYLTALFDENELLPISDEEYAEQLQLQEVLMSSAVAAAGGSASPERKQPKCTLFTAKKEPGESSTFSSSAPEICLICVDAIPGGEIFRSITCSHSFCNDCIGKYVATRIQDNILRVGCPDPKCSGVLEPQFFRDVLPKEVFDRWEILLIESLIVGEYKFYCPFKDCSAVLMDDGTEAVTASDCPVCHRLFCAQCKVAWHNGLECREFQNLGEDERGREDILVLELAKNKHWRRCPSCSYYVEKSSGCDHVTCRCQYQFCYLCGSEWGLTHACVQPN